MPWSAENENPCFLLTSPWGGDGVMDWIIRAVKCEEEAAGPPNPRSLPNPDYFRKSLRVGCGLDGNVAVSSFGNPPLVISGLGLFEHPWFLRNLNETWHIYLVVFCSANPTVGFLPTWCASVKLPLPWEYLCPALFRKKWLQATAETFVLHVWESERWPEILTFLKV